VTYKDKDEIRCQTESLAQFRSKHIFCFLYSMVELNEGVDTVFMMTGKEKYGWTVSRRGTDKCFVTSVKSLQFISPQHDRGQILPYYRKNDG
jgi:hypothetical protein